MTKPVPRIDGETVHQRIVRALVEQGFSNRLFRRRLRDAFARQLVAGTEYAVPAGWVCPSQRKGRVKPSCACPDVPDVHRCLWETWDIRKAKAVPDAYLIAEAQRHVTCVEVDVTHNAPIEKYVRLWSALDANDWDLDVVRIDRHLRVTAPLSGSEMFAFVFDAIKRSA